MVLFMTHAAPTIYLVPKDYTPFNLFSGLVNPFGRQAGCRLLNKE